MSRLELLLRRWEQAKRGDGRVVLICGEPGIGKSRLAQTVVERLSAEPHTRLRYFCSPHHQDSALYPSICAAWSLWVIAVPSGQVPGCINARMP